VLKLASGFTPRRKSILNIIVAEYIATALPVASETILRNYKLGISSATIRNDMAYLEKEGYITKPHTSAGSVPLAKGYRHHVESISKDIELPMEEQYRIRDSFHNVEEEVERWLKLAAALMARLVGNAAVVTFPKANQCRFKHLELVSLHEFLALLILVLSETVLKQQLLPFSQPITQEQLTSIANKLNANYAGLSNAQVSTKKLTSTSEEQRITEAITDMMATEDELEYHATYIEGLRLMLGQPEFIGKDRMLRMMELMEAKDWLKSVLHKQLENERVQVVIGEESHDESLKDLSLVLSRYGIPQKVRGAVGVIGPTRMDYRRAISTVVYMSDVLSYLLAGVCGEEQ
jgi:heat-inducible transcriptional repressor